LPEDFNCEIKRKNKNSIIESPFSILKELRSELAALIQWIMIINENVDMKSNKKK